MKPPIVVVSGRNLDVFRSAEDAERYLESPDVMSGGYGAYDSEGRLLKLEVPNPGNWSGRVVDVNPVKISAGEAEPGHSQELRSAIIDYLIALQIPREHLGHESLPELLLRLVTRAGFTK